MIAIHSKINNSVQINILTDLLRGINLNIHKKMPSKTNEN